MHQNLHIRGGILYILKRNKRLLESTRIVTGILLPMYLITMLVLLPNGLSIRIIYYFWNPICCGLFIIFDWLSATGPGFLLLFPAPCT